MVVPFDVIAYYFTEALQSTSSFPLKPGQMVNDYQSELRPRFRCRAAVEPAENGPVLKLTCALPFKFVSNMSTSDQEHCKLQISYFCGTGRAIVMKTEREILGARACRNWPWPHGLWGVFHDPWYTLLL